MLSDFPAFDVRDIPRHIPDASLTHSDRLLTDPRDRRGCDFYLRFKELTLFGAFALTDPTHFFARSRMCAGADGQNQADEFSATRMAAPWQRIRARL